MKTILVASDHAGFKLKEKIKPYLIELGLKVKDLGTYSEDRCDYPDFASKLALAISEKKFKIGIVICKSGIGVSIVANRFKGVRAALCHNELIAQLSRQHNDSNVLALGSGFVSFNKAKRIIKVWLDTSFEGGRNKKRLNLLNNIQKGC